MDKAQLPIRGPEDLRIGKSARAGIGARPKTVGDPGKIVIRIQAVVGIQVVIQAQRSLVTVEQVLVDATTGLRVEKSHAVVLQEQRRTSGSAADCTRLERGSPSRTPGIVVSRQDAEDGLESCGDGRASVVYTVVVLIAAEPTARERDIRGAGEGVLGTPRGADDIAVNRVKPGPCN